MSADSEKQRATATEVLRQQARDYYDLCERAERLGIPTSLDDPDSPETVEMLRAAVEEAEAR